MNPTPFEILQTVWSLSEGDYVFLPVMSPGKLWHEGQAYPPINRPPTYNPTPLFDQYFTPLKYTQTKRRREFVGRPGVLFADMDDGARLNGFEPHLLIASSENHQHAYWFLDRPYELSEWEPKARGLSNALGADPGGWDSTQVLRVPGSLNHKYSPPVPVRVLSFYPDKPRYPLENFPSLNGGQLVIETTGDNSEKYIAPTTEDLAIRAGILRSVWYRIGLEAQYYLDLSQKHRIKDRSELIWWIGGVLLEAGLTVEQAFLVINPMPWNKYRDRPKALRQSLQKQSLRVESPYANL